MSDHIRRWSLRRWAALLGFAEAVLLLAALVGGGIALNTFSDARTRLVDQSGPELLQATALSTGLLNQETGLRGYLLTKQTDFLTPYEQGKRQEAAAVAELRRLGATPGTEAGADLDAVQRAAAAWQAEARPDTPPPQVDRGKDLFDAVRTALDAQQRHLTAARDAARESLAAATTFLTTMLAVIAALVLILFVFVYLGFRRSITRPVIRLAEQVRAVYAEDLRREVRGEGPREVVQLGEDVDAMRRRILDEVAELKHAHELLDTRTHELERSNSDLEQFAYVASHDLQEPLRKVASFCQLLQRRYSGQLDERGEQYIEFAVDGAKRMQSLINDLLSFSRVGRRAGDHVVVDTGELLDQALANLDPVVEETGAVITRGALPEVRGEATLLTAVLQNLVNNALKFRDEAPPEVRVDAERDGGDWVFSVTDNGIGINEEYAERIFVIFQRLHAKSAYPGTGIGLAMCRKIVEYHGGRIWLDTTTTEGTRFRFTLPALEEPEATENAAHADPVKSEEE
ncbi:sensor histidine kinase [Amycolatopsis minnesotensis]|uniref:histidine kinase n=1 Tax=Amycolatopsis minnesotensis TaxID=337894 RepID=A0ABP5C656_9PSEU